MKVDQDLIHLQPDIANHLKILKLTTKRQKLCYHLSITHTQTKTSEGMKFNVWLSFSSSYLSSYYSITFLKKFVAEVTD